MVLVRARRSPVQASDRSIGAFEQCVMAISDIGRKSVSCRHACGSPSSGNVVAYQAASEAARHDRALYPARVSKPPVGPQWIHEIKHDGHHLIARKREGRVRLFTRKGFDWTERYPLISAAIAALAPASVTIDGEAVWCDGDGLAIFDKLHSRAHDGEVIQPIPPTRPQQV
jgi:ATP-dependent DNA ligase